MKIITLTGPSCSGKTTLLKELVDKHGYADIVSHTTRPMRPGEKHGIDYYFTKQEDFDALAKSGGFMETVSFNGYSYGVSVQEMSEVTKDGKVAVLIVEPQGLTQIKKYCVNHHVPLMSIYVDGDLQDLIARYLLRLEGEQLNQEMAARHAKRLVSMHNEHRAWIVAHQYDMHISKYDENTQEQVIHMIKESEFTND